jgi:integrase
MGRKPSIHLNLPTRMRARVRGNKTYYFYDHGGRPRKEKPLGTDYVLAVQKWAVLQETKPAVALTVGWAIGKYLESPQFDEVSLGTQSDYKFALSKLLKFFGDAPLNEVRPSHIQLYIDDRSKQSRHRALREKAVFSMLYSWAMARDFCSANPVAAIKTKRLPGRKNIFITDDVLEAVYQAGSVALKEAMDLAYYLSQRPADVLKLTEDDVRNGFVEFNQNKTGRAMRISTSGDLEKLIERIKERKSKYAVRPLQLLVDERGNPLTKAMLRSRFEAARDKVPGAEFFQFRDLRRKGATDLREQMGIEAAQALLGHSSVTMTEHYTAMAMKVRSIPKRGGG